MLDKHVQNQTTFNVQTVKFVGPTHFKVFVPHQRMVKIVVAHKRAPAVAIPANQANFVDQTNITFALVQDKLVSAHKNFRTVMHVHLAVSARVVLAQILLPEKLVQI